MDVSFLVACDDDGCFTDACRLAVTHVGNLDVETEKISTPAAKDALLLQLIDVSTGERPIRGAGHTLWRPLELVGADINR
jgi:hypothetical protein